MKQTAFSAIVIGFGLLGLGAPGSAMANEGEEAQSPMGRRWQKISQKLGLDEQQKTKIGAILKDNRAATASHRTAVRALKGKMKSLWASEPLPERGAFSALQIELEKHRKPLVDARIETRLAVLQVMTPEQRAKFREMQALRQANRKVSRGKVSRGKMGRGKEGN